MPIMNKTGSSRAKNQKKIIPARGFVAAVLATFEAGGHLAETPAPSTEALKKTYSV
jgi:hypothetical protein